MKRPTYLREKSVEAEILNDVATNLIYDPLTGIFTYKVNVGIKMKAGHKAGCVDKSNGYVNIIKSGRKVKAHRLAWYMHYGEVASCCIDHIDGDKTNNRIDNLRIVDEHLNQQNRPSHRRGGLWGVLRLQGGKYFQSSVRGKYLGNFKNEADAHACSVAYARKNGFELLED